LRNGNYNYRGEFKALFEVLSFPSAEAESFSTFINRKKKLLPQHIIRGVLRKVDLIEA